MARSRSVVIMLDLSGKHYTLARKVGVFGLMLKWKSLDECKHFFYRIETETFTNELMLQLQATILNVGLEYFRIVSIGDNYLDRIINLPQNPQKITEQMCGIQLNQLGERFFENSLKLV